MFFRLTTIFVLRIVHTIGLWTSVIFAHVENEKCCGNELSSSKAIHKYFQMSPHFLVNFVVHNNHDPKKKP